MATGQGSTIEQLFHVLLHRIGIQLTPQNCQTLKLKHAIQTDSEILNGGLCILQEIQHTGYFCPLKPEPLEEDLKKMDRQDLVSMVKQYKKTEDFKHAQKKEKQLAKRKSTLVNTGNFPSKKFEISNTAEERCGNMLSFALMHAAQTVGQTRYFLDSVMNQGEPQQKIDMEAITRDVKKDFERLNNSLKKAITAATRKKTQENPPIYSVVYKKPSPNKRDTLQSEDFVVGKDLMSSMAEGWPNKPAVGGEPTTSMTKEKSIPQYDILNRVESGLSVDMSNDYSVLSPFSSHTPSEALHTTWRPVPPPPTEATEFNTLPNTSTNASPARKQRTDIKRSSSVITKGENTSDVRASTLFRIQNMKISSEHHSLDRTDSYYNINDSLQERTEKKDGEEDEEKKDGEDEELEEEYEEEEVEEEEEEEEEEVESAEEQPSEHGYVNIAPLHRRSWLTEEHQYTH